MDFEVLARRLSYLYLVFAIFVCFVAAVTWNEPSPFPLSAALQDFGSLGIACGSLLGFLAFPALRQRFNDWFRTKISLKPVLIFSGAVWTAGLASYALSAQVADSELKALGFDSLATFQEARDLGIPDGLGYQTYLRARAAKRARISALDHQNRLAALALAAAKEKLVVGRWIMPIDRAGYVLTIRHNDKGYEALFQYEGGRTSVIALNRHLGAKQRYDADDVTKSYFTVLEDKRLQLADRDGPATVLDPFLGNPRDTATIDAAIQSAFLAAQAVHEEENCRKDAQCWSERYRLQALPLCEHFVEREARYEMQWTNGLLQPKFLAGARWSAHAGQQKGLVDFIGDQAKFQNGFGAWQNVVYVCTYDTNRRWVVGIKVEPGRLGD